MPQEDRDQGTKDQKCRDRGDKEAEVAPTLRLKGVVRIGHGLEAEGADRRRFSSKIPQNSQKSSERSLHGAGEFDSCARSPHETGHAD